MKKKTVIIVAIICILGILLGGVMIYTLNNHKNDVTDGSETGQFGDKDDWLTVDTIPKLENLAKKNNINIEYEAEYAYLSGLPFADGEAFYSYEFDENKLITGLNIGYKLVKSTEVNESYEMETIDEEELAYRVDIVMDWLSKSLNVEIGNNFYIITDDGDILSGDGTASYQQIIDGTAFLELRILDVDGSVWVLSIELIGTYNIISCTLEHCAADSDAAKIPCYVAIE